MPKTLLSILVLSVPVTAAATPDWCKPMAGQSAQSVREDKLASDDAREATEAIVRAICTPQDAELVPKAETARKTWSTKLSMADADWSAAAEYWAKYDQYAGPTPPNKKGFTGLDPLDQYLLLANYSNVSPDGHYVADAAGPLSEAGRLGYAIWCVRNNVDRDAHLAACAHDIAAVDIAKVAAEARADKAHEPKIGFAARMAWYRDKDLFAKSLSRVAELGKADPAYAQMFAIADKAFKTWDAAAGKRQKLLTLAGDMDTMRETQSRKAQQGCEDKLVPELRDAVSGISAASFASVLSVQNKMMVDREVARAIVATPEGYLAAAAYTNCMLPGLDYNSDSAYLPIVLGQALARWPGYRGPHSAAIADIMQAGLELDQRGKELTYPDIHRDFFGETGYASSKPASSGIGVIAAVKPAGKQATVSFANNKVSYPVCTNYKAGTKITGIMANGEFERAGTCSAYKQVSDTVAVPPKPIDARFASGLKPGQFSVSINQIPYASWMPNAKAPATVLGVPVK